MGRIDDIFGERRAGGGKALMPFVCAGYPGPGVLARVLPALEAAGASVVEIGIPFSDPIADGPVIAAAMHEALRHGSTPRAAFEEIGAARTNTRLGLVAMVSVSIVWRFGVGETVRLARAAGVDGFIFPDLPPEEGPEIIDAVREAGMTVSLLVAPTTTARRAERIVKACSGFVYLLARAGITGESRDVPDISATVKMLRGITDLPIACGFGISSAHHVRAVVEHADAAIVGSALVRRMGEAAGRGADPVQAAADLVRELAVGLT